MLRLLQARLIKESFITISGLLKDYFKTADDPGSQNLTDYSAYEARRTRNARSKLEGMTRNDILNCEKQKSKVGPSKGISLKVSGSPKLKKRKR